MILKETMRTVRNRKHKKKQLLWLMVCIEISALALVFKNGSYGYQSQKMIAAEAELIDREIILVQHEIALFKKEITLWQAYPFYKEKAAREQLQMCYPDEIIYVTRPHSTVGVENV